MPWALMRLMTCSGELDCVGRSSGFKPLQGSASELQLKFACEMLGGEVYCAREGSDMRRHEGEAMLLTNAVRLRQ